MFEIRIDGAPSGIVADAREDAYGFRGYNIREICLDVTHRGKRFGPHILQHLAHKLPSANPDCVLWGHIHPANTPSLRNALSIGREIAGRHVWLTPDGYPGMLA